MPKWNKWDGIHNYSVRFRSVGASTLGQWGPVSKPLLFCTRDLAEVPAMALAYIAHWNLCPENWPKILVMRNRKKYAVVTYHGKLLAYYKPDKEIVL